MSITPTWKPSGAPCDSCGQHDNNHVLTLTLTNAKAELGYKLPDLSLCQRCRSDFRHQFYTSGPVPA